MQHESMLHVAQLALLISPDISPAFTAVEEDFESTAFPKLSFKTMQKEDGNPTVAMDNPIPKKLETDPLAMSERTEILLVAKVW